ncbi:polyketide synthase [Sporothrix brasiliensis 5110]|uniref:Polyketide synthase n=1 Tax=Sporothrix brasiliensis 5110 TaxID=1398154 RepID=A0A0C2IJI3_9PEZI|nr:polyketide synthase [Sporothrix brasiliensis 5110]KIH89316.1 polyketide synthase [Sporothrix brasiliensis 5110]
MASPADPVPPVAIIGLGGRFPGEATDPLKLYDMCAAGADAWTEVPASRFNHAAFYHPDQARNGATNVTGGFYLRDDVAFFDAPFFGITQTEAASLDPQQRLLLECSYEALENAGLALADVAGSDMGVFVGSFCFDWAKMTLRDPDAIPLYHATGTGQAMLANRLSYFFNLHGPSVTLDTACSSSLVALHQACQALRAGECSTALVAGVNCALCHDSLASMSSMGFLSAAGRSFTYDRRAAGYGRGEGVAALVLRRVDAAVAAGNSVRAVVRNTGVNQDGRTPGITFPSGAAQAALIRRVYAQAGLDLADTSYVEAHGTGTQAGDPIEARALAETFGAVRRDGPGPLVVGCIKTNIGHLEGASGAAGLIKTVLMLERETLLPNCDFREANDKIPLADWHLTVPTRVQAWRDALGTGTTSTSTTTGTTGTPAVLRASINGFGYGGTNAHVIVESAADFLRARGIDGGRYAFSHGRPATRHLPDPLVHDHDHGHGHEHDRHSALDVPADAPDAPDAPSRSPSPSPTPSSPDSDGTPPTTNGAVSPTSETHKPDDAALPVPQLFVLSAHDAAAGKAQAAQLADYLASESTAAVAAADPRLLSDLAYTLSTRRSALPWKAAVAAASASQLAAALRDSSLRFHHTPTAPAQAAPRVGFVFTGQGAQWFAMGRELAATSAVFRASLDRSAAILASSTMQADWSLHDELLRRDAATTRVNEPAVSQPLCTVLQVALVDLLRSWGVAPAAVVGHSSGEIGAAYAAGLLSQEAAVAAAYFRVPLDSAAADACRGGMVALACDEATTRGLLAGLRRGTAVIACYNSPQSFTVSGDDAAIEELAAACTAAGVRHRTLVVGFAYHSHRMAAAAEAYRALLQANETVVGAFAEPVVAADSARAVEMYSSVTGRKLQPGALTLDYWVENLVSPVRFTEALTALCYEAQAAADTAAEPPRAARARVDVLVEVGPHAALAGPIRQILQTEAPLSKIGVLSMLRRGQDATATAQQLACALVERGVAVDVAAANADARREGSASSTALPLVDLPPYPWNHSTAYWAEPRDSIRYRQRAHGRHDLLGAPVRFGSPLEPRWRQWIRTAETPWVRDHRVQGLVVYPAAGYISMAIEAVRQVATAQVAAAAIASYELRDVSLGQALIVPEGRDEVEALVSLRPQTESAMDSSTHCRGRIAVRWGVAEEAADKDVLDKDSASVTDHAALAAARARQDAAQRQRTRDACTRDVDTAALYDHCTAIGLEYGPTFANLTAARAGAATPADPTHYIAGTVVLPDVAAVMPARHHSPLVVHPGTLDACLHGIMAFRDLLQAAIMPVFFAHISIDAALARVAAGDALNVYLGVQQSGFRNLDIHLTAYGGTDADAPLIRMDGLRMTSLAGSMPSGGGGHNGHSGSSGNPPKTYFQAEWRPDPAFLSSAQFDDLCAHLMPDEAESAALRRLDQGAFYMADAAVAQVPPDAVPALTTKGRKLYASLRRQRDAVLALHDALPGATAKAAPVHADDIASWPNASPAERAALLDALAATGAEGRLLAAVAARMHEIVLGTADPLEVTMQGDVLGQYYAHNPRMARQYQQAAVYVDLLAHKNPHMRILEIGAGTGGATLPLLHALGGGGDGDGRNTLPRFASYDVTDISSGFFEAVQAKTQPWASLLRFRRLDIERDPVAQGVAAGAYDLVVAANVLHATRNMARTVRHARRLLRPGGTLLLIELVRVPQQRVSTAAVGNIFGIFDGWWVAEEPHRQDSPLLAEAQWDAVLKAEGFSGLDAAVWETPDVATHQGTTMISTAVYVDGAEGGSDVNETTETETTGTETTEAPETPETTNTVTETEPNTDAPPVARVLGQGPRPRPPLPPGTDVPVHTLDDLPPITDRHVCVVYQTDPQTLGPQTPASMDKMRALFLRPAGTSGGRVLWLTRGASDGASAPDFALVQGLLRTLRVELGGRLVHLDLDVDVDTGASAAEQDPSVHTVARVYAKSFGRATDIATDGRPADVELELAVRGRHATVHIPRYDEARAPSDYVAARTGRRIAVPASPVQPGRHLQLMVGQPGLLDSLYFDDADADADADLPDDHVEIAVRAAGLNFHDVMVAMGQIETRALGRECAGVVRRVGRAVTAVRVGDRVAAPADGTFATTVRCAAWRAQVLPDSLSFAAAAALPIVLCTALHAVRITQLAAGETVLIHAASGGLGQALVQLCQQRGAVVYATVGTPAKKQLLVDQYGLDPAHIFSSRDDGFADAVRQATGGAGVDVVFNVLAGELLRASWRCVAAFGRFVELGKRDLGRNGRLDMAPFARNVTFVAVDLVALLAARPRYGAALWADSMDLVRAGVARAPAPLTAYAYADAVAALRTMQAGRHVGKLVLVPEATEATDATKTAVVLTAPVMSPRVPPVRLRADASYLLVGGLGGIGRALAARMVHALGARHLILLSRGDVVTDVAAAAVADLRGRDGGGARVHVASNCDVGRGDQLAAALAAAQAAGFPPVRGVVHLGLVMESALFQDMSSAAWNHSLWPKVAGTWNLHRQLPQAPGALDFFVLLSSMVGTIGNPSQAAYGAASTFQDAFARYRRRRGLPATTLDLGMVTGIGYVAEHGQVQQTLRSQGFEEISGDECLALVESAMLGGDEDGLEAAGTAWSANYVTGLGLGRYAGGDPARAIYQDPRFAMARRMALYAAAGTNANANADADADPGTNDTPTRSLREAVRQAASLADVVALLAAALRAKITALLMLAAEDDLDPHKPLSQYGLDSLIAVELRNWVSSEMEATVPVLEFLGSRTTQSLSGFIARQSRLVKKELLE